MYFSLLHGHGTSFWPGASGAPTECMHGTTRLKSSSIRLNTSLPIRAMIRMLTTTYGESVSCTPICDIGEPIGPMLNGSTYIVRPRMQPSNSPSSVLRISNGSTQLLVGPGGFLRERADEGAILDARDVARVAAGEEAAGPQLLVQPDEGAALDHLARTARRIPPASRRPSGSRPACTASPSSPPSGEGGDWCSAIL